MSLWYFDNCGIYEVKFNLTILYNYCYRILHIILNTKHYLVLFTISYIYIYIYVYINYIIIYLFFYILALPYLLIYLVARESLFTGHPCYISYFPSSSVIILEFSIILHIYITLLPSSTKQLNLGYPHIITIGNIINKLSLSLNNKINDNVAGKIVLNRLNVRYKILFLWPSDNRSQSVTKIVKHSQPSNTGAHVSHCKN
jgi:hypothetical protein